MSENSLKFDAIAAQLRDQLNNKRIKLWLPPYYNSQDLVPEKSLKALATEFSLEFSVDEELCLEILRSLQTKALEKLHDMNEFLETGFATLNIHICGKKERVKLQVNLDENTENVLDSLQEKTDIPADRWKLIYSGKILTLGKKLSHQGVKNTGSILAIILEDSLATQESLNKEVENIRADLKYLAERSSSIGDLNLKIEDQNGCAIDLPREEKESLITAMILHEKGCNAVKEGNFLLALVLLLEADEEYMSCTSSLLECVDNYAVCNLDIVWTYLCLRSLNYLPGAEERLRVCEASFRRSYGNNFERLIAIKGTAGCEQVLFMRLHLLQGVLKFHQNNRTEAIEIFQQAKRELQLLKISEANLILLLELGFTASEARVALRAAYGDINEAAEYANWRRKEKEAADRRNREKRRDERLKKRCGRCIDNSKVDIELVKSLLNLELYEEDRVIKAVMIANNNKEKALKLLDGYVYGSSSADFGGKVEKIMTLGYPYWIAHGALEKSGKDYTSAVKQLELTKGKDIEHPLDKVRFAQGKSVDFNILEEAYQRVCQGLYHDPDDYLDITLEMEEEILIEYNALLGI